MSQKSYDGVGTGGRNPGRRRRVVFHLSAGKRETGTGAETDEPCAKCVVLELNSVERAGASKRC